MAFIQTFVSLSCPVTAARWMVAVPCCSRRALVLLAMCPPLRHPIVSLSPGCQMKDTKLKFLESVCTPCRSATERGSLLGLELFCCRHKLAEKIEELLNEEPQNQMRTEVRLLAFSAITALSSVVSVLQDSTQLMSSCFRSVLCLPPEEDVMTLEASLYTQPMLCLALDISEMTTGVPGLFPACASSRALRTASTSISTVATGTTQDLVKPRLPVLSPWELTLISKGLWECH
ncbi:uncharacterized protein LOC134562196 [Prinia subflava]|uniref:uncharacterized protein LOC134562196 n=1 Tax=Prinia subflava TaxID=208062 RepID=UPI002FE28023